MQQRVKIFVEEVSRQIGKEALEKKINAFLKNHALSEHTIKWLQNGSVAVGASGLFLTAIVTYTIDEETETKEQAHARNLERSTDELELSIRAWNALTRADICTVEQLIEKSEKQLSSIKGLGRKSLSEIKEVLQRMNLHLNS